MAKKKKAAKAAKPKAGGGRRDSRKKAEEKVGQTVPVASLADPLLCGFVPKLLWSRLLWSQTPMLGAAALVLRLSTTLATTNS